MASAVSTTAHGAKVHDYPHLNLVRKGAPTNYFTRDNGEVGLDASVTLE